MAMQEDMQILANRRVARGLLVDRFLRPGEPGLFLDFANEKFDQLLTYLSQNDLQVHGADASATVGIYSFVKIVGEIRRSLSKLPAPREVRMDPRRPESEIIPTGYNPELLALVRSPRKEIPQASPSYMRMGEAEVMSGEDAVVDEALAYGFRPAPPGSRKIEMGKFPEGAPSDKPGASAGKPPVSRALEFSTGEAPTLKGERDGSGPKLF